MVIIVVEKNKRLWLKKNKYLLESLGYFPSHIHSHFLNQQKKKTYKKVVRIALIVISLSYEKKKKTEA